jgi:hypothetical protein
MIVLRVEQTSKSVFVRTKKTTRSSVTTVVNIRVYVCHLSNVGVVVNWIRTAFVLPNPAPQAGALSARQTAASVPSPNAREKIRVGVKLTAREAAPLSMMICLH